MTRPVPKLAPPPGERTWTPPDWDPEAISADYLLALREQARTGELDPAWIQQLMRSLAFELRAAYTPEKVERAVARLDPLIAEWERYAARVRAGADKVPTTTVGQAIELTQRSGAAATAAASSVWSAAATLLAGKAEERQQGLEKERERAENLERPGREARTPAPAGSGRSAQVVSTPASAPAPSGRLAAASLNTSIVPTWLALVALSWVAVIWGALMGMPLGMSGVAAMGVIAVPIWGTIFGFMGMRRALDSTLKQVGFQPMAESDPLAAANQRLASSLGIRAPRIGTMDGFNAFAMGTDRNNATVTLGRPLLEKVTAEEAEAVLGHELGHVVSGDMKRMMLMRTFQNATVWYMVAQGAKQFARWIICWAGELYILAFSRKREYWADAIGAALTSKEAMIGALKKLADAPPLTDAENTHARFMVRGRISGLFSTHPSPEERIVALQHETYLRQLPRRV